MNFICAFRLKLLLTAAASVAAAGHILAGSATWSLNPVSTDWNTAANWTPATVPNAETDVATFGTSSLTNLTVSNIESLDIVASLEFDPGADIFTITCTNVSGLDLFGAGVVNKSGETQQFVLTDGGFIYLCNNASCGDNTNYSLLGGTMLFDGGTAATAHFAISDASGIGGGVAFVGGTAASATFDIGLNGDVDMAFADAANATFNVAGGTLDLEGYVSAGTSVIDISNGGIFRFDTYAGSDVSSPQVTVHGASASSPSPGHVFLIDGDASNAALTLEGGSGAGFGGASLTASQGGNLDNATVTMTGGEAGGGGSSIALVGRSDGGSAAITLSGNAAFDLRNHNPGTVGVGSLAGTGLVYLSSNTLRLGSDNLNTEFSGVISEGPHQTGAGSLHKVGTGTLTLSGVNTYTGGTTLSSGGLIISNASGSGTGTGSVTVDAGTLAGNGIIAGAVTLGTGSGPGAFVAPGQGSSTPVTLTLQNTLTFASDGTYTCRLNTKKTKADRIAANGVSINGGAQFVLNAVGNTKLSAGTVFTVINNTSAAPISGTFANLADGATLTVGSNALKVSYEGGDGNDLMLTVQ